MTYLYLIVCTILFIALPIALGYHYEVHRSRYDDGFDYFLYGFLGFIAITLWPAIVAAALIVVPFWLLFKLSAFIKNRKSR